jgi:hypothetical protein
MLGSMIKDPSCFLISDRLGTAAAEIFIVVRRHMGRIRVESSSGEAGKVHRPRGSGIFFRELPLRGDAQSVR